MTSLHDAWRPARVSGADRLTAAWPLTTGPAPCPAGIKHLPARNERAGRLVAPTAPQAHCPRPGADTVRLQRRAGHRGADRVIWQQACETNCPIIDDQLACNALSMRTVASLYNRLHLHCNVACSSLSLAAAARNLGSFMNILYIRQISNVLRSHRMKSLRKQMVTDRLCDGTHTSFMCESDERHIGGWVGTGGARLAYCDWLLWRSEAATATLNRLESWFEQWAERNKNDAAE